MESMGVASGCGCKEVYRFPHITYPYILLLHLFFFAVASLLFVHFIYIYRHSYAVNLTRVSLRSQLINKL